MKTPETNTLQVESDAHTEDMKIPTTSQSTSAKTSSPP